MHQISLFSVNSEYIRRTPYTDYYHIQYREPGIARGAPRWRGRGPLADSLQLVIGAKPRRRSSPCTVHLSLSGARRCDARCWPPNTRQTPWQIRPRPSIGYMESTPRFFPQGPAAHLPNCAARATAGPKLPVALSHTWRSCDRGNRHGHVTPQQILHSPNYFLFSFVWAGNEKQHKLHTHTQSLSLSRCAAHDKKKKRQHTRPRPPPDRGVKKNPSEKRNIEKKERKRREKKRFHFF